MLVDYFTPGNIVTSYGGFDLVIESKHVHTYPGEWYVTVIACDKDGKPLPNERERCHSTMPAKGYKVLGNIHTKRKPIPQGWEVL